MAIGIQEYGVAIPGFCAQQELLAELAGQPKTLYAGLGVSQKSIPGTATDSLTLGLRAASSLTTQKAGCLFFGSETPLYAVNPTSSMIVDGIGMDTNCQTADVEFACKAGTVALDMALCHVATGRSQSGIAVASDCATGKVGDPLHYTAGAGAAAFLVGKTPIATIESWQSYSVHRLDFWRSNKADHPIHAGAHSNETYIEVVCGALQLLLNETQSKIADYAHVILHQPNAKLPLKVAQKMVITRAQLAAGWLVPLIGNTYAACIPLGLCAALDEAKIGDKILCCSYGSGAGADAFVVTKKAESGCKTMPIREQIAAMQVLDAQAYNEINRPLS